MTTKEQKERWLSQVEIILGKIGEAQTPEETLQTYGRMVRRHESVANRYLYISKVLRATILAIMKANNLTEIKASRRTFLRIDQSYSIPSDEEGEAVVGLLKKVYGGALIEKLVEMEEQNVPAHTEKKFKIRPEELNKLTSILKEHIAQTLGNTSKLFVGDIPKRVFQGKERRTYRGR